MADSTLDENLQAARMANSMVGTAVSKWGASDKWFDQARSLFLVSARILTSRAKFRADQALQSYFPYKYQEEEWETHARYTMMDQVGNCSEQACLAAYYLRNMDKKPLELMSMSDKDHLFVVIGRDATTNERDPSVWGPNSVICDPWMGQAYAAAEFYNAGHMKVTWGSPVHEITVHQPNWQTL